MTNRLDSKQSWTSNGRIDNLIQTDEIDTMGLMHTNCYESKWESYGLLSNSHEECRKDVHYMMQIFKQIIKSPFFLKFLTLNRQSRFWGGRLTGITQLLNLGIWRTFCWFIFYKAIQAFLVKVFAWNHRFYTRSNMNCIELVLSWVVCTFINVAFIKINMYFHRKYKITDCVVSANVVLVQVWYCVCINWNIYLIQSNFISTTTTNRKHNVGRKKERK